MRGNRRWKTWPSRVSSELNSIAGIAGIGGTAMGFAGWKELADVSSGYFMVSGFAMATGSFGFAVYKSIPPLLKRPQDVIGETLTLAELEDVEPGLPTVAMIGTTHAGKTTLKRHLAHRKAIKLRTSEISAFVVSVPDEPHGYFAILDASGERLAQQFLVAEKADCLCLVLDHNFADDKADVEARRLEEHREFLSQIRHHLNELQTEKKDCVLLLVNKRDLWENASNQSKTDLLSRMKVAAKEWEDGRPGEKVAIHRHSNNLSNDIAAVMNLIWSGLGK